MEFSFTMKRTRKILRKSIHIFIQDNRHFTSTCSLLALPFSVSVLLLLTFGVPSTRSVLPNANVRLRSLFDAAGFPTTSEFFKILNLKLSQTMASWFVTLPFSITFLLFVKSCVIASLNHDGTKPVFPVSFPLFAATYKSILATYVCNSLLILSANATAFSLLLLAFNCLKGVSNSKMGNFELFMSIAGAVLYSIILAHALVVCNLALVLAGSERTGGSVAILKACAMIGGSTSTSLSLAVAINLAFAVTEALFQFRVVRSYQKNDLPRFTSVMEALLISYLYSMLIVLDAIVGCIFYQNCKEMNTLIVHCHEVRLDSQTEIFDYHKCSIWNAEEEDIKHDGIGSK